MQSTRVAGHTCCAYCRGNQHAEVVWLYPCWHDDPDAGLRETCGVYGWTFLHGQPAPEMPFDSYTLCTKTNTIVLTDPACLPFLMTFRVGA